MYADFMSEHVQFLIEAGLAKPALIIGFTDREIAELESQHPGRLPEAYRTYLRVMGYSAGTENECEKGTRGWDGAHRLAPWLAATSNGGFRLTPDLVPFSQYEAFQLKYFYTSDGDDPQIFRYMEGHATSTLLSPTFTSMIREGALYGLELDLAIRDHLREMKPHHAGWDERRRGLQAYADGVTAIRSELIKAGAKRDATRGRVTGHCEFQRLWNEEFPKHSLYHILRSEGKRIPFGWLTPKEAAAEI